MLAAAAADHEDVHLLQIDLAKNVQHRAVVDAVIELWNVRAEYLDLLIAQREQRQHDRNRPPVRDIPPLNNRRRETEPGLQAVAVEPVGRPAVPQVVLRM